MMYTELSNREEKVKYINENDDVFFGVEIEGKEAILNYLTSFDPGYATSAFVFDEIKQKTIEGVYDMGYFDGVYYWDGKDIYHFKHYNMPLNVAFIKHVSERLCR